MSKLTLTERQLRAVFATIRTTIILPGSRMPVAQEREIKWVAPGESVFDTSDETHLTQAEQVDMYERLAEYLFPKNREDHEHEIGVR